MMKKLSLQHQSTLIQLLLCLVWFQPLESKTSKGIPFHNIIFQYNEMKYVISVSLDLESDFFNYCVGVTTRPTISMQSELSQNFLNSLKTRQLMSFL